MTKKLFSGQIETIQERERRISCFLLDFDNGTKMQNTCFIFFIAHDQQNYSEDWKTIFLEMLLAKFYFVEKHLRIIKNV